MADYQLFIDGRFVEAEGGETFVTVDPSTGEQIGEVARAGREDAVRAIEAARAAFDDGPWPRMHGAERAKYLGTIAELVGSRKSQLAELETRDSGGTIRKSQLADVAGCQSAFRAFARLAESMPEIEELRGGSSPPSENYVRREPYGVCSGIIPWNFPLMMAAWKIAPAIAAGNTVVLKPASYTSLTALELARIVQEAGVPEGVVNVVPGAGGTVGEELASHPMVDKVAFTGSTEVGRRIMQLASGTVKKVTLELGGKSANVVLPDADLDVAAAGVLWGTFLHGGQVCESGTRALVHADVYDEFVDMLVERAEKLTVGNPLDFGVDLGPLVSRTQVDTVERYVQLGRDEGAKLLCGGSKPDDLNEGLDRDAFYRPTVFETTNDTKIAREEIFGPVLSVIRVGSDEEAIEVANDSMYGLAGGVWSEDLERAKAVAHGMRTGTVWINDYHLVDASRPFGGYKQSGVGRELGPHGFNEYRQIKHVHVNPEQGRDARPHFQVLSSEI